MFKHFSQKRGFEGFPRSNFRMQQSAYNFPDCLFWLDASFGVNTQVNLDPVIHWTDRISGIRFQQDSPTRQPRYVASDANFNNFPSVQTINASRSMIAVNGSINPTKTRTLAFVAKADAFSAGTTFLSGLTQSDGEISLGGTNAAQTGIGVYNAFFTQRMVTTIEDTAPHIVLINENEIWVDGVSQSVTGTGWTVFSAWLQIFGQPGLGYGLQGRIAEILLFNQKITGADAVSLSDNINAKYAIY